MRDTLLGPLARVCVAGGIAPAGISFASVAVMAGFMAMARVDLRLAAAGLLIANLMDGLDGVVARQQLLASDRGKFTDVVCGSLNLALFGTGLVYAGLLDGALGVFGVFLLMFSKVLRMIHHGFIAPSDWLFKPVAGFTPNLICAAAGGLFLLKAFGVMTGSLNPWFAAFILILIVDVALAYAQVLKLRP